MSNRQQVTTWTESCQILGFQILCGIAFVAFVIWLLFG